MVFPLKRRLILVLACLALVAGATPLLGEEEPYFGIWERTPRLNLDRGLFLYQAVLRYQARSGLRSAGTLPDAFRAVEDSLGMRSDRFEEFVVLQDSLGQGWEPPTWARIRGREIITRQISAQIDSGLVTEAYEVRGTAISPPVRVTIPDYLAGIGRERFRSLWAAEAVRSLQQTETQAGRGGLVPELALPIEMPGAIRSIVGSGKPNLNVRGSERISFSGTSRWYPDRPVTEFQRKQSKFPSLDMKQELNLQLTGNIGDKVSVDVDQSSQAATPLSNRIKIHYKGYSDEILQKVDLGNTSLSLPGTQYVSYGGSHQGLFGINAQALVGDMEVNGILSKQEGKNDSRSLTKGAEIRTFQINDWEYKQGKFFFLTDPDGDPMDTEHLGQLIPGSVQVWIDDRRGDNNLEQGTRPAYVTLDGREAPRDRRATGDFYKLTENQDYIVQNDVYTGYPVLILNDSQTMDGRMTKALAVSYSTTSGIVGDLASPDTLVLKLIRPASEMGGTNPLDLTQGIFSDTRRLELRNIYDLGSNLSADGLNVKVRRKVTQGGITNPDRVGDITFLSILGLDLYTDAGESQTPGADTRIDRGRINYESGYVMFCQLQPFAPTEKDTTGRCFDGRPMRLPTSMTVPKLYERNDWSSGTDPSTFSQYVFEVTARTSVSRITLNAFNILQGSEVVTAGSRTLVRDRDYTIDYDTGEIQILDAAEVRDTEEIRVNYSYLPFGGGSQKTLMGAAFRFRPESSKLGLSTTWIYESKGAPGIEGQRPRLGQEPTRTVVGELATSYKADSWSVTNLVDHIPGVNARASSPFSIDAGLGLSFPNPNTKNELYIDDFEGAKDETEVSMNRLVWRPSGVPRDAKGGDLPSRIVRHAQAWWYTPRAAVKEGDLQPTVESRGGLAETEKDNNRQVLEIRFFPRGDGPDARRESWFSLVTPLSQRGTDLSRAQFLDIWVNDFLPKTDPEAFSKRQGRLHIDLGVVSEDALWKRIPPEKMSPTCQDDPADPSIGRLDTEDRNRDGQLDAPGGDVGEDVGLDQTPNADEVACDNAAESDPADDDWEFQETQDQDNRDPGADPTLFSKINGTERNGRLDSEDLNGNLILDLSESYYAFTVDLADESLVEFESSTAENQDPKYAPFTRGWRRIRVPLTAEFYKVVGAPTWDQVRHVRVWVDSLPEERRIQIGGIQITGNRWLKGAIRDSSGVEIPQTDLEARGEDFFPAVLNNKDNSAEYNPPFKPKKRQNVEEREQSLTLEMRNLRPGDRSSVYRTYTQPQDFAGLYRSIQFWLNRLVRPPQGPETVKLEFYIRLARNANSEEENYYEYRTPVPADWELKDIDMQVLSQLQRLAADSSGVVRQLLDDSTTVITRKGSPSLTSIQRISFGVINVGNEPVTSASIWIDELRLSEVKRDAGVAERVSMNLGLSDVGALSLSYTKQDANFLKIGSDRGSGTTRTDMGMTARWNLDRHIERTGLRLPVTFTLTRNRQVPKFRTNSDLVVANPSDRDVSEGQMRDINFSVQRARSANPWLRYTVDGLSLSGRAGKTIQNTPDSRDTTRALAGQIQYNLPIQGGPAVRVFRKTELKFMPSHFTVGVSGSEDRRTQYQRKNGDLNQPYERRLDLTTRQGTMNWSTGYRPHNILNYTFDQSRDLRLNTAPRELLGVSLGTETSRRQQLTASQQFSIAKRLLVPKVSWAGNFDGRFNQITTGADQADTRSNNYSNGSTISLACGIPIDRILNRLGSLGAGGGGGTADVPGNGEPAAPEDTTSRGRGSRGRSPKTSPTGGAGSLFSMSAVSASYTIGRSSRLNRVAGDPSIGYQLGFSRTPGASVRELQGMTSETGDRRDLNLATDFKFLSEVTIRTTFTDGSNKTNTNGAMTNTRTRKFPDLDINWGRLHKKIGLDRFAKDLRASTRYSRETSETGTSTNPKDRSQVSVSMRPFLNLDATVGKGITAKFTSSFQSTEGKQYGVARSVSRSRNRQLGLGMRKSLNLTRMVTNPITKKTNRVTSKLDLSLSLDMQDNMRASGPEGNVVTLEDRAKFAVSTTAGYNFTSSISGNAGLTVGQDTDRKNKTNTARYVSITLSASFNF